MARDPSARATYCKEITLKNLDPKKTLAYEIKEGGGSGLEGLMLGGSQGSSQGSVAGKGGNKKDTAIVLEIPPPIFFVSPTKGEFHYPTYLHTIPHILLHIHPLPHPHHPPPLTSSNLLLLHTSPPPPPHTHRRNHAWPDRHHIHHLSSCRKRFLQQTNEHLCGGTVGPHPALSIVLLSGGGDVSAVDVFEATSGSTYRAAR